MYSTTSEGPVRYTRSKDNKKVYAITTEWPGKSSELKSVTPGKGTEVHLLGDKEPLKWSYDPSKGITTIEMPDRLQEESKGGVLRGRILLSGLAFLCGREA